MDRANTLARQANLTVRDQVGTLGSFTGQCLVGQGIRIVRVTSYEICFMF